MSEPTSSTTGLPTRAEQPQTKKKHNWWAWLILVVVVLLAWYLFRQHQEAEAANAKKETPARSVPIQTAAAKSGDVGIYINNIGTVTPVYTVTVTSRVQGQIMEVYYKEGQLVHKGDPLLDIDPRPYQAALTQAQGALAHDQAVLAEARIDYDRYKAAYSRNAIAKQQMDDQEQVVAQDEGTVKNDEGVVENAKVNLVYCHITSPIEGRVGLRLVDPGNIVQANSTTSLVVITQLEPITVIFSVSENYLPQIQEQMRHGHTMTVDALNQDQSKKIATGSLLTLDNQVDTTTGTVKLKAVFANKEETLFPNQFVNAKLLVDTLHNATTVPAQAIQRNAQGPFVYVIGADQKATLRTVKLGPTDGDVVAVQGVNAGEVVATNGFDKLQDGAQVTGRQPGQGNNPATGNGTDNTQSTGANNSSNSQPSSSKGGNKGKGAKQQSQ